ncbi:gliding motility-associated ABC transporter permease subunit GldF [Runella sp. CRIBMP]|uniref:Gliding motility-associated ABC transporter permease subunit GldF n=1 Tax=Runella aurantiaca TaxID=2282308 RepID=A0A369IBG6_9BACT|nr:MULTISPECIES: gliding motility-associated ABC transporter permease subunit GldF [Runella]NBB19585.1 gliding motility-associated ABC transporter permease subunit GldF [Runella sp. CRIBMP]RDB06382.1 gliding motility-associated ABC transporter permease subunit GldF [Runella aurantiaca]
MLAIFRKEINSFFSSLTAYIVMAVFLTAVGLLMWVFPDTNILNYGYADLGTFFNLTPFVLLFLIPAITMRALAEEVRNGTIELLLTKPLSTWGLILGKFWASWALALVTLLPTLLYYYSIYQLGNPVGNVDSAQIFGSYIGLALLSAVFVAVGLWTSSLSDNQIVAFVLGVFISFLLYNGIGAVAKLDFWGSLAYPLSWISLDEQYADLGRGLIDSRNVIYLFSITLLFLWLTQSRVAARRK